MKRSVAIAMFGLVAAAAGCDPSSPTAAKPEPAAVVEPARIVVDTPAVLLQKRLALATTLPAAIALTKPEMKDAFNDLDRGTALLAVWSINTMSWSDVSVAKSETSFAAVMKDPDEARGKRMCASGSIIQIEVAKTAAGKLFTGLFYDYAQHLYQFAAVGSTGELVASSSMRFCGVVTGKYDYSNSVGGTGHAINLVGMFDLPENRVRIPSI